MKHTDKHNAHVMLIIEIQLSICIKHTHVYHNMYKIYLIQLLSLSIYDVKSYILGASINMQHCIIMFILMYISVLQLILN
jgi:hypothetical protein